MKLRLLFLLIIALLAAIGVLAQEVKIKAGDKIRLMCEEESALNKDYVVSDDGLILIDFLGAIKIADLTEKQSADKISKQLVDERILSKATIRVEIVRGESQYVRFEGAVDTEGETPFKKDLRLDYILLLAGPKTDADLTRIQIISASGKTTLVDFSKFVKETNANNPVIQPGDKVVVPKKVIVNPGGNPTVPETNPGNQGGGEVKPPNVRIGKVKIEGAVFLVGEYDFAQGMTVREAILRAGGYGNNADTSKVVLSRGGTKRELKMPDDANFALQTGDTISIPATVSNEFIIVSGSVHKAGRIPFSPGMRLSDAVRLAGGFVDGARKNRITVLSTGNIPPRTVNFEDIELGYTGDLMLKPGQTIEVDGPLPSALSSQATRKAGIAAVLLFLLGT